MSTGVLVDSNSTRTTAEASSFQEAEIEFGPLSVDEDYLGLMMWLYQFGGFRAFFCKA